MASSSACTENSDLSANPTPTPNQENADASDKEVETVAVPKNITGAYMQAVVLEQPTDEIAEGLIAIIVYDANSRIIDLSGDRFQWSYEQKPDSGVTITPVSSDVKDYSQSFRFSGPDRLSTVAAMRTVTFSVKDGDDDTIISGSVNEDGLKLLPHAYRGVNSCDGELKPFADERLGATIDLNFDNHTLATGTGDGFVAPVEGYEVFQISGDLTETKVADIANSDGTLLSQLIAVIEGALYEVRDSNGKCEARISARPDTQIANQQLPMAITPGFMDCSLEGQVWSGGSFEISDLLGFDMTAVEGARLFWLDFRGDRVEYPDGFTDTFKHQVWVITDLAGKCITLYAPEDGVSNPVVPAP